MQYIGATKPTGALGKKLAVLMPPQQLQVVGLVVLASTFE